MAGKTKAEADATREGLLDAAEEAFLERGVAYTSLEEVANRAGVTRGAIYWHFHNKLDLLGALLDRVRLPLAELLEQLAEGGSRDPLGVLRNLSVYALRNLARNQRQQRVYTIVFHRCALVDGVNPVAQKQGEIVTDALLLLESRFQAAADKQSLHPAISPATAAYALHVFLLGTYNDWLRDPARFDLEAVAEDLVDALFRGLSAR